MGPKATFSFKKPDYDIHKVDFDVCHWLRDKGRIVPKFSIAVLTIR